MNVLIDTHIAIWAIYDNSKLTEQMTSILLDKENTIYYSLVSAWEVEIKHNIGKSEIPSKEFIKDCENAGFSVLSLKKKHIIELENIPFRKDHRDPFDRLLIAQAKSEEMWFLTKDGKILSY